MSDEYTGEQVRELRIERGWSQLELANHLDMARKTVSMWERYDRTPSYIAQYRLRDVFTDAPSQTHD